MDKDDLACKFIENSNKHAEATNNLSFQISRQNDVLAEQTQAITEIGKVMSNLPVQYKEINDQFHTSLQLTINQSNQVARLAEEKLAMKLEEQKKLETHNKLLTKVLIVLGAILIGTLASLKAVDLIRLI